MPGTWQRKSGDGTVSGPFAIEELEFLARRGRIRATDLVREDTQAAWKQAGEISSLQPFLQAPKQKASADSTAISPAIETSAAELPAEPPAMLCPPAAPIQTTTSPDDSQRLVAWTAAITICLGLLLLALWLTWRPHEQPSLASGDPRSGGTGAQLPTKVVTESKDAATDAKAVSVSSSQPIADAPAQPPAAKSASEPRPMASTQTAAAVKPTANSSPAENDSQMPPAPKTGSSKPVEPERRGNFISAGALNTVGDTVLAGGVSNQQPGAYQGRSGPGREEALRRFGGDEQTERAVYKGLQWLANHQRSDGGWSLEAFAEAKGCSCSRPGEVNSDTAATALALLPFLGAGEIYQGSKYHSVVAKGLTWLLHDQRDDGSFKHVDGGNFYAQGMATLALCEMYGMTRAPALHRPAQQAVDYLVEAQHAAGGWRYQSGMAGDLSVTGWQIMALRSGKLAGLSIPQQTWTGASRFLDQVQCDRVGSAYGYLGPDGSTARLTAIGLLCREYTGWKKSNPGLQHGSKTLLASPPSSDTLDIYYWYYGTLVLHHLGGGNWQRWNEAMKSALLPLQSTTGHETGSWKPESEHDRTGGRLYMTALAICTLEVYYRYLPLYQPHE